VRTEEKPKAAPKRESQGVDDLLSKTLSGLEVGDRLKRPPAAKSEVSGPKPLAAAPTSTPAGSVSETVRIPTVPLARSLRRWREP
jgi:hypothetical protein